MGAAVRATAFQELIAGKYRVEGEIGHGAMGVVLAATHVDLDQRVAIKLIHAHAADDPESLARFLQEARAAAKIHSEHVARVIDVGTLDDGRSYIVMEHLEGCDLAEVLQTDSPLPVPVAVSYALEVCEGLAAAHAAGVVHRDLKPANIFLARQADVSFTLKVLDFGVSKILRGSDAPLEPQAAVTHTGQIFGSPAYMSPEQLRSSGRVDARADIWALGVVLYQMLAGELPFGKGSMADLMAAIVRDPPASLRLSRPEVPEALEEAVLRCLAKAPEDRYRSVADLALALQPFGPEGAATRVERIGRLLEPQSRRRADRRPTPLTPSFLARAPEPASSAPTGTLSSGEAAQKLVQPPPEPSSREGDELRSSRRTERRRVHLALGGAFLLALALLVVMTVLRAPRPVALDARVVPPATSVVIPVPAALVGGTASAPAEAARAEVTMTVTSAPPGTKVYLGETLVGEAPGEMRFARGSDKITLRLVADGHVPAEMAIVPDIDRVIAVELKRLPAPSTRPKTTVPKDLEPF
ncbi:serine/threonine-protein kinase [Polyangium aurulentum]|uniref:serine/threonine-protein kinase n=1 Tax=Polyangium aurulentum TaxID=2567896 RepID=UPI0010AE17FD|nr:serine/threonine-protein kinase [Polyangium aurulentum]UQA54628.1 protein kinase [Polyangium aurulentum]